MGLLLACLSARAQNYTMADTATVQRLLRQASDSINSNAAASVQFATQARDISRKIDYSYGIIKAMTTEARALVYL